MSLKYMIVSFVSNPIVILFILIFVILIGFYNINIAVLVLLLLFIILYGTTIFNNNNDNDNDNDNNNNIINNKNLNKIEGFTDNSNDSDDDDDDNNYNDNDSDSDSDGDGDDNEADRQKFLKTIRQEQNDAEKDETIANIKNTIFGTMNSLRDSSENAYQKSLLENKNIQYKNERKINKQKQKNINNSNSSKSRNSNSKKENFQTISTRAFDPNKEEDTNFLITKEILQDMINRVDYNFESSKYLKKYLKHRIEEIVEINKLLDDDDD
jgi:hypothetical protein